jgi:hypothetical protein
MQIADGADARWVLFIELIFSIDHSMMQTILFRDNWIGSSTR